MFLGYGGDNNGNNDNHSVTAAALVEYPDLWPPSLGPSPGQYASLFGNLSAAGDGLYRSGGGGGDRLRDGHRAFAAAMNPTLQGLLCYTTINIKERR
jgi:hypothetical protein